MKVYHCTACNNKFPKVAWIISRYLLTDHGPELIHPTLVKNDPTHKEWSEDRLKLSDIVAKPCCPFCLRYNTLERIDITKNP